MSSDFCSGDDLVERGSIPLDIDNVHLLLQVEQEQIQKKTFTNWVNAQLAKRRPPTLVLDLFNDFRDGSKLLDLLEVMSSQRFSRERGRGMFQHRSNIEKALSFLKKKSIKLVNINIPNIMDGKPSIILGLIWTIILQYHIEELASALSFSSRQSSMESLTSLDSRSNLSSRSASSSPVPPRGSPLHKQFRLSAKKALLLWVREQCHKAGCTLNVKDFKSSWRSGVVFLAILYALRPDVVDLSKARTRSNKHNLEEAFRIAERELRIPRLLDPDDVDVRDPDEKSIMTYVAQFLQYSRDLPVSAEAETPTQYLALPKSRSPVNLPVHYTPAISASPLRQATPDQKAKEVTCWLGQAYNELLEGWDSTEGERYSERFHVFHTFLVSLNEQRRPIMPLLTAMRRNLKLTEEQRALREAWDVLTEKLREYKIELDMSLPAPLDTVAHWLLKAEGALAEEESDPQDHGRAADRTRENQDLLRICLEEMPKHVKTFQSFQNLDEYGNMMVPDDKMDELKRRFTGVRVSAKYHGIKLEYREHRHTVLDLLGQIGTKLRIWKRPYISPEAVRVLLQEWHELVNTQELPSLLEVTLQKLKQVSEKYSNKSALATDYQQVSQQVKQLEEETAVVVKEVNAAKGDMGRVLSAWDSYSECLSSLQAWLEQGSLRQIHDYSPEVTSDSVAEWGSRHAHLNQVGKVLIESTDPQTSRSLAEELRRINAHWVQFVQRNASEGIVEPSGDIQTRPQDVQALIREATFIFKEPVETMAGPLRTYRKRMQFLMRRIKEVDLEVLTPSPECPADQLQRLKLAIPEVMQTLFEAEQVCAEVQHSVSGLDSRLAELLLWETEARELYQLLRAAERQHQAQDPRTRVLISRGLQLEGQVVTEEQDLQVMVLTSQKNSPIQYLRASAMQNRVRATVAQSQEAVGMLSSLGARRERSRTPPVEPPPPKVFIEAEEKTQHLIQSDTGHPTQNLETELVSHQVHGAFVPKIVVQEHREEAEAVMQTRKKSPPGGQAQALSESTAQHSWEETFKREMGKELQKVKEELKEQLPQELQQKELMPRQPQQWQLEQGQQQVQNQQQLDVDQYHVDQHVVTHVKVQPQDRVFHRHIPSSPEPPPVRKPPMSSQELQSRKAQALKNRPWLQKPATGEHKDPAPEQDSTRETVRSRQSQSDKETVKSLSGHIATPRPQLDVRAQVKPFTPMQGTMEGQIQPSVPYHIQFHSHPESWAPVGPPTPKAQIHTQIDAQPIPQSQTNPQSIAQPQTHGQPMTHSQVPGQPMSQAQNNPQPSHSHPLTQQTQIQHVVQPQGQSQPLPQHPIHAQPAVQHPGHISLDQINSRTQIRPSSPLSIPHAQVQPPCYPRDYSQGQSLSQQWIYKQESHTQNIAQQRHQSPQPYPQPIGQSTPSQYYPKVQAPPEWPQAEPQFVPQIAQPGYSYMGSQMQTPTQPQVTPQTSTQQQSQMRAYDMHVQTQQTQVQQQSWVQESPQFQPQLQPQRHPLPQSLQYSQVQQLSHHLPQSQPRQTHPPLPSQPQLQPQPQPHVSPRFQQSKGELPPQTQPEFISPTQSMVQAPTQPMASLPQSLPHTQQPQLQAQSPPQSKAQTTPQSKAQSPPQPRPLMEPLPQSEPQNKTPPQPKPPQAQTILLSQVNIRPESVSESPDLCSTPPALSQVPPQAYTEAYAKAQALARNGFEEAKYCLQEHILETIKAFEDRLSTPDRASVEEEALSTLDTELLEEFLRAAEGMEAFCTPSQLGDMEIYTQSVRTQWESCVSADGSVAEAGRHLEALKRLCDTLSPEDAHRLAQTQLRECEKRLAAIQRQFSGDHEAQLPESRIPVAFSENLTTPKEHTRPSDNPHVSPEVCQVTMKTAVVEREVEKQASVEEDVTKKEAFERYENCKRTLMAQLAKNEQSIRDVPSDSVSLKGLHTRLQEIQFLRQETESLWSEYSNQLSQYPQLSGNTGLEQEKAELREQWRSQQPSLQRRGSSLGAALRQIDSTENHMVDFIDRLDRYLRQPKPIAGFTLANTNILKDIKELDDNIQSELDQVSRLDPESSDLDPRDCLPLSREVETHRASLDQLRQQVRKSEAAARALDHFLMSLRTLDEDISGVQDAPCGDAQILQGCRTKLVLIGQSIDSLKGKAPLLDVLLQGARLTVTRDGVPASCLDMVTVLLRRLQEVDGGLVGQQSVIQKETESKSLGLRKRTLLGELRRLQDAIEMQGLKEPTMPAVQHRLRALSDLEGQLQARYAELQQLRELQDEQGGGENLFQELETQWKETRRAFSDREKQCNILLELLKVFQRCRSALTSTTQRAEQTIGAQASYMGKDNLQRRITKVGDIKEELAGLGQFMEEMRGVCRQLQSQLKTFPDCSHIPFEAEADTLMDNWLDVTEKTDAYTDNLRVALELWEKQLVLGVEVDSWAGAKLALFAESHPFHNEQQVLDMTDEIHANEENVEHFHKKYVEIQEMLQTQEAPPELQAMETQLRKRMEQVKELFTDCTDVFEELVAVKTHLAEKLEESRSAVERIQCSVVEVDASQPAQIQDLCDELDSQAEQAEAVMKEVGLVSSMASPQMVEGLSEDCHRLREAISRTKDMIRLKREERDKGMLKVIKDEKHSFLGWFQDLQLSVNECFENPESRADAETSLRRLTGFLKSKDAERRLDQLKDQVEGGAQQVPPQQLSELTDWLKEQQEEVGTFRTHCHNRQKQMESLLSDLNSLQRQHDSFCDWLQTKEKQSVESDEVKRLLKDLQDESGRTETLSELIASVRRQGVRAESLLKDGDNLIQRYRNLEARLQRQADTRRALEGELDELNAQTESIRAWITDLLQPLASSGADTRTEEMKSKAQAVLNAKPEGDSKVNRLRGQSENLCRQEDLQEVRKREIEQSVRETEGRWTTALQAAQEALDKAEMRDLLQKDVDAFKTQVENVQSWIGDQEQSLQPLDGCMQVEEKLQAAQATLSSKPCGDSKLQNLKQQCQNLSNNPDLEESRRREVQDAVRHTEEQWSKVLQAAEEALNKAETEASAERVFDSFKNQSESILSWIREQRQKLPAFHSPMQFEELQHVAQAVMASRPEGESKVLDLRRRGETLCDGLDEIGRARVRQLVENAVQQLGAVVQATKQTELRALSEDFDAQHLSAESWIRERRQELQSVGAHTPPEERRRTVETTLNSKPEGDRKVNNLRRRGQTLCAHPLVDEGRKAQVQRMVRDTEEQWRTVLQAAKEVEAAAGVEIIQCSERREMELSEFEIYEQDTGSWLLDIQQKVDSLYSETNAEDRLHLSQAVMSIRYMGASKLLALRRRCQSLCAQDLGEDRKQELQQKVRAVEEQWTRVLQNAKQVLVEAQRQCALEAQLKDFKGLSENTRIWLEEKLQSLVSLDCRTDPVEALNTAQTILTCKAEGDSKLAELRRQSQSLSQQQDLEESAREEVQKTVDHSEEQWGTVLQSAESTLKRAEVQYALSREAEAFRTQAESTKAWVKELQQQAETKGSGSQGTWTQIEDRLKTAQAILSSSSNGEAKVKELKRRAQSLCEQKDMEEDQELEVQQTVRDAEQQWRTVLVAAEETQRQLKGVVERLVSCQQQRDQAEACLSELQKQASNLPRVFPWPGLGERRQAVEQAQTLLDRSAALASILSNSRIQAAELFDITQDRRWSDPSWEAKEESIPVLLKELTAAMASLQQGIVTERQCTQLVEQHEAAQDWLREQVKGLGAPPADRQGLHSAINTLKALLQTVDREQREMKELDSARDSLLTLCAPGGRDALTLEVGHLHDLCATSEQEVRERLLACETRLGELDSQLARNAQGLRQRAAALKWELRSLNQALSYCEPQNIDQLQQHWHSLQNCEKSLEDLGVKVHDLYKEVKAAPATDELPTEIITMVESLSLQYDSLKSRLSEQQGTFPKNTARCLIDCLHALQEWTHSKPPESSSSVQVILDEGEKLQLSLRDVLSHQQLLTDCLMPALFEKLEREGSETLREAQAHTALLNQSLKVLNERSKQKASLVAPPRKNKQPPEKNNQVQMNMPLTEKSVNDEKSVSAELQTEAKILKSTSVDQSRIETTEKESESTKYDSEHFTAQCYNTSQETQFKIPSRRKSNSIEVSSVQESVSSLVVVTDEEPRKMKQELDNDPTSPAFGQGMAETAVVEQTKCIPPKRKSKTAELPFQLTDTEVRDTNKEPEGQKASLSVSGQNNNVIVEKTKFVPTRRKSKSGDFSKSSETDTNLRSPDMKSEQSKTETDSQKSSSPDVITKPTQSAVVEKEIGNPSPTKEKSKGQTPSVNTETTVVEKGKHSSTMNLKGLKRPAQLPRTKLTQRKENTDTQKSSSTPVVIKETCRITVVEKGVVSSNKRESGDLKLSPELTTTNQAKTKEGPKSQKPFSTPKAVRETGRITVVEKGKPSPTKIMSKDLKHSPQLPIAGVTRTKEERSIQKPSSTPKVVTDTTKTTSVAKGQLSPNRSSPELTTTKQAKTKEGPKSQKPFSAPEVVTDTTEPAVVEKGALSPMKSQLHGLSSGEVPEQTITQSSDMDLIKVPQPQPPLSTEPAATQCLADYIDKLCENSDEIQKRLLVLDLPEVEVTQVYDIKLDQSKAESVVESDTNQPSFAVLAAVNSLKVETESSEISSSELEMIKPSETSSQLKLLETTQEISFSQQDTIRPNQRSELLRATQETPEEVQDYDVQGKHGQMLTHGVDNAPKSLDEKYDKEIYLDTEVHILALDVQASPEEENKPVPRAKRIELVQTSTGREGVREEVEPKKGAIKAPTIEVLESSTEWQDNVAKRDSAQPFPATEVLLPDEKGTKYLEISLPEQDVVELSLTETHTDLLKTTQERPKVVKGYDVEVQSPTPSTYGMNNVPKNFSEQPFSMERIQMGPEVHILQLDTTTNLEEKENTSIKRAKESRVEIVQTSIQCERVLENKGRTSSVFTPEKAAVEKTMVKVQDIITEREDNALQRDIVQPTSLASGSLEPCVTETEFVEISIYDHDILKPSPMKTMIELNRNAQGFTEVKEQWVQEEQPEVSTLDVRKYLDVQSLGMEKICKGTEVDILQPDTQVTVKKDEIISVLIAKVPKTTGIEVQDQLKPSLTVTPEITKEEIKKGSPCDVHDVPKSRDETYVNNKEIQEPRTELDIQFAPVEGSKDVTTADIQPDKSTVKMTRAYVQESYSESLSEPSVFSRVQTDSNTTDAKDKTEEHKEGKKWATVEEEKTVKAEIQLPTATNTSPDSPQADPQKSSADVMWDEATPVEALPTQENKAQAEPTAVKPEKADVVKVPKESALGKIFTEVQLLMATGPNSQLIEDKPLADAAETLITSTSDLDNCVSRLVSKILNCKSRPAELNPTAVARQLEEAKECRETAQAQLSLLSQLSTADADSLELVKDKWSTAVRDADAVIQSKQVQLQLVTDYCRQTKAVKNMLKRLTTELEIDKMSPEESSSKEAERLGSLQRSVVKNRKLLEELHVTHGKLCPHLSRPERAAARTEQSSLKERWTCLEKAVERTLYQTNVHSHEISSLLSSISSLQEQLETIIKDLEAKPPSVPRWNCKKVQELMMVNSEVKAAQQNLLILQQLSEALLLCSQWDKETKDIQQGLQRVQDQLCHAEELVSSHTQSSSNPVVEKMIKVMRDGLAWAKQTESDIEGRRKRVPLLPEEVHRQLRDLKKLQSEFMAKQGQLESLVEEVTELLPQLDQFEEVHMVRTSLESLEELSQSTAEKLAKAVREIESGLENREKLSERIADLDSWVMAHLHKEASRCKDDELSSPSELHHRVCQVQETLTDTERQAAICDALLLKGKDMASELSITDNCQLFNKLTNLQMEIQAISTYEKANKEELDELTQMIDSANRTLVAIEESLQQMLVDLTRHRYPITRESLLALEPLKHKILEQKSQVDLLEPLIPQEKTRELYSVISEIHSKITTLEIKSKEHERYLYKRQWVEDFTKNVQELVRQTEEDHRDLAEKYTLCQTLTVQFPLIKTFYEETHAELQKISTDMCRSQLNAELRRLKLNEESLDTLEITLYDNLSIIERALLNDMDLDLEKQATQAFLLKTQEELQKCPVLEPNEAVIKNEYQRIMSLKETVKSRMRALGLLALNKKTSGGSGHQHLIDFKNAVFKECDSKMENVTKARESLRNYICTVRQAVQFLRDIGASVMPPQGSARLCSERLEEAQQALTLLQQQFQTHVQKLQNRDPLHPYLFPDKVEQLQENILKQIMVRMSTLQAQGHIRLECLNRCAENHKKYTKCKDEIIQNMKSAANILLQILGQRVTSLADCTDQQDNLKAVSEEVESLHRRLEELKEWCPEQHCCGGREADVTALRKGVLRLIHCKQGLTTRCKQRITEWSQITDSVEKASVILEQVEAELSDMSEVKASTEELQDLLHFREQYQYELDCEHRALSALEIRIARLLAVPAHLEQAPPAPLFQQLHAIQTRYGSVKQRCRKDLEAARAEVEEREKVLEELHQVRLEATGLSEMEQSSGTQELQEVHSHLCTQKASLHYMKESLKIKYLDMDSPVPAEIEGQLQEVTQSLQRVEVKVGEAIERSGPVHRLGANLSEIQAGLRSVRNRFEQRSPSVTQAEIIQKRVWDELDVWHSCLAALEVDMQDLEKPEEALALTERLVEVQQLHSQLANRAEQRTSLIGKIRTWLLEHQEMINSSSSWMSEAQSWLAAPCTYTTAKCLSRHVRTLKTVLDDSIQIRTTLQGFSSVLKEMSQVCDVATLREQLVEADRQVAGVQESYAVPLSRLEHAAAEVEAVESEVRRMENDVTEIKTLLSSPETLPSPREEGLKSVEQRIQSMRTTVAEIQKCKPGLCLPDKAEETLTVFTVVDRLQTLLPELEKEIAALLVQLPPTPIQAEAPSALRTTSQPSAEAEESVAFAPEETTTSTAATSGRSTDEPMGEKTQDVEGPTDTTGASPSEALSKPQGTVTTQSLPESMVNTASTVDVSKDDSGSQSRCVVS